MPVIDRDTAYASYLKLGFNSSHFVWYLANLKFYRTANGFIFGFTEIGGVTLFALEPLIPDGTPSFTEAWDEIVRELKPRISAFVSVYQPFLASLREVDFQYIRIGSEPWVKLTEWMPTGNSGRGVRSAKNFAIKAGLTVEEWPSGELEKSSEKRETIQAVYRDWAEPHWLNLSGFTLSTDPFQKMSDRRYFILRSPRRIEGYGVATPVPKTNSYYLEDMILRRDAPKGAGELLTLEVMSALNTSGAFEASLGVVPSPLPKTERNLDIPPLFRFLLVTVPAQLKFFYNLEGMELYRKRFKPHRWADVYFAVRNHSRPSQSDTAAWFKASLALFRAFRPRLNLSPRLIVRSFVDLLKNYPITVTNFVIGAGLFAAVNHGGNLPESALSRFGFAAALPLSEWFYRSVASDFLYTDPFHFYTCFIPFIGLLIWAENTQRRRFLVTFLVLASVFDDFINYVVVILPFKNVHGKIFEKLIAEKQVGCSLVLALLLGYLIVRLRRHRELVFVVTSLVALLGIISVSRDIQSIFLNLNHFFFISFGFIVGKVKFEWDRSETRKHAKDKPPQPSGERAEENA
jgi:hypothetical protein